MWAPRRCMLLLVLLGFAPWQTFAQARMDREGVTLYWGLVPGAIAEDKHALADLHGGPRKDGGKVHHLVVAVFDTASGRRIDAMRRPPFGCGTTQPMSRTDRRQCSHSWCVTRAWFGGW